MRNSVHVGYFEEQFSHDGGRLGRHIEHDERSRGYAVPAAAEGTTLKSQFWPRQSPILDQGSLGSCTGNAMAGAIATDSARGAGRKGIDEHVALRLYQMATRFDHVQGEYPPDDTGSTGLAVAKAAQRSRFISNYRHAFSLHALQNALQVGPAIVGMTWLTGCDSPDGSGLISYTGDVRGGHEVLCRGIDFSQSLLWFDNSWGAEWGLSGSFAMRFADFEIAMHDDGDMTVPIW